MICISIDLHNEIQQIIVISYYICRGLELTIRPVALWSGSLLYDQPIQSSTLHKPLPMHDTDRNWASRRQLDPV